ncbi:MAG TPA: hypothetical protein PKE04_12810, partial [Clostridia bacterium]|nr:hypothetical protein [Clostridia bacterium]
TMPSYFFFEGEELEEYEELYSTMSSYINQCVAEFTVGTMDFNSDWNTYVSNIEAYGLNRYLELLQKGYEIYKGL